MLAQVKSLFFARLFVVSVFLWFIFPLRSATILGGSLTYECMGNGLYVFELTLYKNCSDTDNLANSLTLKVWNHPVIAALTVSHVSTIDLFLQGTNVSGSSPCFNCSNSQGVGSVEGYVFRSTPIELSGIPPADGWVITFDGASRPDGITNLQDAQNQGITLETTIFSFDSQPNLCNDNSPTFLQMPYFVGCVGRLFSLNLHLVDLDADSLSVVLEQPLSGLNSLPYVAGSHPVPISFQGGFSATQPTPSTSGSQSIQIDAHSGEMTFLSQQAGVFNVKIKIRSFRHGVLISEVVHEQIVWIVACSGTNTLPSILPPFMGSFQTEVMAGNMLSFTLSSSDLETLPDGTPQSTSMFITSPYFGPDPSVNTGCVNGPCPTISPAMPIWGIQGSDATFTWQTSCNDLLDVNGNEQDTAYFDFVVRVQDNYCPIPAVNYQTVQIKLINTGVIPATQLKCIQGLDSTTFSIEWFPVLNTLGTFVSYQLHSVQSGLIATLTDINTTSYLHMNVSGHQDYFVLVVSGCAGQAYRSSDTLSSIFLDVSNTNAGLAVLNWNAPIGSALNPLPTYYYIFREYPSGTWTLIDSVPWGTTNYSEEIRMCSSLLHYQISVANLPCDYLSSISGGVFTDQTPPDVPLLTSVSLDTATHQTVIQWTAPAQPDTYGYIIYKQDPVSQFLVELDTVFGKYTTTYTYFEPYTQGPVTYTVAAFDSCPSPFGDPFNLSARDPNFHTTIFLKNEREICQSGIRLFWTHYAGWATQTHDIFVREENDSWHLLTSTQEHDYIFEGQENKLYYVAVRSNYQDGSFSFSNIDSFYLKEQHQPSYSYIRSVSVTPDNKRISIRYQYDTSAKVTKIDLQRENKGQFETIQTVFSPQFETVFEDDNVFPNEQSYLYRVIFYDSCGNPGYSSNIGKSILLQAQIENIELKTYVFWTSYEQFVAQVDHYVLYRSVDGSFPDSISSVLPFLRSFEDKILDIPTDGRICYRVEARETNTIFGDSERSLSNEACVLVEPVIYVPNAFSPHGNNPIFAPVFHNYRSQSYKMTILNRWGQVVFQTNNPHQGWDGRVNNTNKEAESTVYSYVIELENGQGEQVVTRGHLTLLR